MKMIKEREGRWAQRRGLDWLRGEGSEMQRWGRWGREEGGEFTSEENV